MEVLLYLMGFCTLSAPSMDLFTSAPSPLRYVRVGDRGGVLSKYPFGRPAAEIRNKEAIS